MGAGRAQPKRVAAAQYLNACLEDNDPRVFLLALREVAEARGGIRSLWRNAHLNRESLYRMLSKSGNPSLRQPIGGLAHVRSNAGGSFHNAPPRETSSRLTRR